MNEDSSYPRRSIVVTALGIGQILAFGSSYYLLAVLARPIAEETGWPLPWVISGMSIGLLTAGITSPRVGDTIQHIGGRPVLAASTGMFAIGLLGLAVAPSLPFFLGCWVVIGLGMGAGLYEAAFVTLGRLYGQRARVAIATVTVFGGFASTACWPLSAALVSAIGWRGACLGYAAIYLAALLPMYLLVLPREGRQHGHPPSIDRERLRDAPHVTLGGKAKSLLLVVAAAITLGAMISAVMSVHLLSILEARGMAIAAAVALGALVGPSQVAARALEMLVSRYHHPIWTLLAATLLVAVGIGALWARLPVVPAALAIYGAGVGIESIARGTVPLALFCEHRYAAIVGRIAMPTLIAQAIAPSVAALFIQSVGVDDTLAVLFGIAIVDVVLTAGLFAIFPREIFMTK